MRFLIPGFVPVPSPETMQTISIISLAVGICLVGAAAISLFLNRKRAKEERNKLVWVLMGTGALLILNHSIQLLF